MEVDIVREDDGRTVVDTDEDLLLQLGRVEQVQKQVEGGVVVVREKVRRVNPCASEIGFIVLWRPAGRGSREARKAGHDRN